MSLMNNGTFYAILFFAILFGAFHIITFVDPQQEWVVFVVLLGAVLLAPIIALYFFRRQAHLWTEMGKHLGLIPIEAKTPFWLGFSRRMSGVYKDYHVELRTYRHLYQEKYRWFVVAVTLKSKTPDYEIRIRKNTFISRMLNYKAGQQVKINDRFDRKFVVHTNDPGQSRKWLNGQALPLLEGLQPFVEFKKEQSVVSLSRHDLNFNALKMAGAVDALIEFAKLMELR